MYRSGPFDRMFVAVAVAVPLLLAACTAQSERLGGAALPQTADTAIATAPDAAAAPPDAAASVDPAAPHGPVDAAAVGEPGPADAPPVVDAANTGDEAASAVAATTSDPALVPLVTAANVHWLRIVPVLRTATAGQSPAALVDAAALASDGTQSVAIVPADGVAGLTAAAIDGGATVGYVAFTVCCRPTPTRSPIRNPYGVDPLAAPALATLSPRPITLLPDGVFRVVIRPKGGGGHDQQKTPLQTFVAELRDAGGRVVESWPAVVSEEPTVAGTPWAGVGLDRGGPVTMRFHAGRWKIEASRIIP